MSSWACWFSRPRLFHCVSFYVCSGSFDSVFFFFARFHILNCFQLGLIVLRVPKTCLVTTLGDGVAPGWTGLIQVGLPLPTLHHLLYLSASRDFISLTLLPPCISPPIPTGSSYLSSRELTSAPRSIKKRLISRFPLRHARSKGDSPF